MRISLTAFALLCAICSYAQIAQDSALIDDGLGLVPVHDAAYDLWERQSLQSGQVLHASVKPLNSTGLLQISTDIPGARARQRQDLRSLRSTRPLLKYFYQHPQHLFVVNTPDFSLRADPILEVGLGSESGLAGNRYINTRGGVISGTIANRISFRSEITENQIGAPSYVIARHDSLFETFPGEGRTKRFKQTGRDFFGARGHIAFRVVKDLVHLQLGQEKHHIGPGYRSLFMSRETKDMFFLRLDAKVWKFRYVNLFTDMLDYRRINRFDIPVNRKYGAFHHLSFEVYPKLNVGVFEGVIHGTSDTTQPTRFEFHYLNPIIFYRAVEFQLGSADNVVLGLDWDWRPLKGLGVYGQVVFDELKFFELVKSTGWWANKFGTQFGLKYSPNVLPGLLAQAEVNVVRPYTFSHKNRVINYSHYGQPLAHPAGANFTELLLRANYRQGENWEFEVLTFLLKRGVDADSISYGANIHRDPIGRPADFGIAHLQGFMQQINYLEIRASRRFLKNVYLDAAVISRQDDRGSTAFFVWGGVRMNVAARRFRY